MKIVDVIYGGSLVLPGAPGLVARVHDGARLLQRRHGLLQRRKVLLLELVRQVALDLAVRGRCVRWYLGGMNMYLHKFEVSCRITLSPSTY